MKCEYCGVEYIQVRSTKRYCSRWCQMAAWGKKHVRVRMGLEVKCPGCGKVFNVDRRKGGDE